MCKMSKEKISLCIIVMLQHIIKKKISTNSEKVSIITAMVGLYIRSIICYKSAWVTFYALLLP